MGLFKKLMKSKKPQTIPEFQQEYGMLCAKLGHQVVELRKAEAERNKLLSEIDQLNKNYSKAMQKAVAARKPVAQPTPSPAPQEQAPATEAAPPADEQKTA